MNIEFINHEHFTTNYKRKTPPPPLSKYIDFIWETDFSNLFTIYPNGFSDAIYPNIGYTYGINLGTPYSMQLGGVTHQVKNDVFLPRHKEIICHHKYGNKIFGIRFKASPILWEKDIDFSEYRDYLYPLSYLIDQKVLKEIKESSSFERRCEIVLSYYKSIIKKHNKPSDPIDIVTEFLEHVNVNNAFEMSIQELSAAFQVNTRTMHRYFMKCIGISPKQAIQILRIRKAITSLVNDPAQFDFKEFGYFDHRHFYGHCRRFLMVLPLKSQHDKLILKNFIQNNIRNLSSV